MMRVRKARAVVFSGLLIAGTVFAEEGTAWHETTNGILIPEHVEEMPALPNGLFVRLKDQSILAVQPKATKKKKALISDDDGKTWHWQACSIFKDADSYRIGGLSMVATRDGVVILVFSNYAERHWTWDQKISDAPGAELPTYVTRSLDGGKTWEKPQLLHREWTGANRDMIQMDDGKVVISSMMLLHDPGRHAVVTYASTDNGATWKRSNLIDLGGTGREVGAMEATFVSLRDGRIWMLIRTIWGKFWEAYSDDGLYWQGVRPSDIDACSAPGLLKRLDSGRIVLIWNRMKGDHQDWDDQKRSRAELYLKFSEDEGKTWTRPVLIARKPEKEKNPRKGVGVAYPKVFEVHPGELWLTTGKGDLRVRLFEKDFVEGR